MDMWNVCICVSCVSLSSHLTKTNKKYLITHRYEEELIGNLVFPRSNIFAVSWYVFGYSHTNTHTRIHGERLWIERTKFIDTMNVLLLCRSTLSHLGRLFYLILTIELAAHGMCVCVCVRRYYVNICMRAYVCIRTVRFKWQCVFLFGNLCCFQCCLAAFASNIRHCPLLLPQCNRFMHSPRASFAPVVFCVCVFAISNWEYPLEIEPAVPSLARRNQHYPPEQHVFINNRRIREIRPSVIEKELNCCSRTSCFLWICVHESTLVHIHVQF